MFTPVPNGLRVLMYHKISEKETDFLTVHEDDFRAHLSYLKQEGYSVIGLQELLAALDKKIPLPPQAVLITFDDAYESVYRLAAPLLAEFRFPAAVFIPVRFAELHLPLEDAPNAQVMDFQQIKTLAKHSRIEFGLHTYAHFNYRNAEADQIQNDIGQAVEVLRRHQVPFLPAFAYAYGGRPKSKEVYAQMLSVFREKNIRIAFRIGNRVNRWPMSQLFEIQRIDIRGDENFREFSIKVKKGRAKMF